MMLEAISSTQQIISKFQTIAGYCDDTKLTSIAFSQNGTSEQFIGEWMEARGVRDQMIVATKVKAVSAS